MKSNNFWQAISNVNETHSISLHWCFISRGKRENERKEGERTSYEKKSIEDRKEGEKFSFPSFSWISALLSHLSWSLARKSLDAEERKRFSNAHWRRRPSLSFLMWLSHMSETRQIKTLIPVTASMTAWQVSSAQRKVSASKREGEKWLRACSERNERVWLIQWDRQRKRETQKAKSRKRESNAKWL